MAESRRTKDHDFVPDLHNGGQLCIYCDMGREQHDEPTGAFAGEVESQDGDWQSCSDLRDPRATDGLAEAARRVPDYYRTGTFTATGEPAGVFDVVDALWGDQSNYCEKDVLKYLVRAGRKPGVPTERDWLKIVRVAARKYRLLTGEDLPDDV